MQPTTGTPRDPVDLAGLSLASPVLLAAGTVGVLDESAEVLDLARVGGIVTKSITLEPREGHPPWRLVPSEVGMLNAIGLANPGIDAFVEHVVPRLGAVPTNVIVSIAGHTIDDYIRLAAILDDVEPVQTIELNVSCPNVKRGTEFGSDPVALAELIDAVRPVLTGTRLFVKLSPVTFSPPGIDTLANAAIYPTGKRSTPAVDALVIANTIPAMTIDVRSRKPRLANTVGGFSGPALHPITLKLVYDAYRLAARDAGVPIVALGGILNWKHAAQYVLAGATAVAMGTAMFIDPRAPIRVAKGLARWTRGQGASHIRQLVGAIED